MFARTVASAAFHQKRTSSHKHGRANPTTVTQSSPTTIHVGLDVAKLTLQADLARRELALPNTSAGHKSLLTHLRRLQAKTGQPAHVVCEGTGGYERAVVAALQAADQPTSVHNIARARAQGRLAKTDTLDAAVLSDFGEATQPTADVPPTESEAALAGLVILSDDIQRGGDGAIQRIAKRPARASGGGERRKGESQGGIAGNVVPTPEYLHESPDTIRGLGTICFLPRVPRGLLGDD